VYCERDRIETARTVAAILREENSQNSQDDVSTITGTVPQAQVQMPEGQRSSNISTMSNTRSINQVSLDHIGQAFSRRRLNAISSGIRKNNRIINSLKVVDNENEILSCRAELDSHADTCGLNNVAQILEFHGQVADVSRFSTAMQSLHDIPIVKGAVAYNDHETGEVIVLVFNQALYFGDKLSHILLNPNQMRTSNIKVDDIPKHLCAKSTHSIMVEEENLIIPMKLNGIISYFNVRTPTLSEIENCPHINMTSAEEWNPYSHHFEELENKIERCITKISAFTTECMELHDIVLNLNDKIEQRGEMTAKTTNKRLFLQDHELATRWGIGLKDAEKATTKNSLEAQFIPSKEGFARRMSHCVITNWGVTLILTLSFRE
jgi:hypothetical protein